MDFFFAAIEGLSNIFDGVGTFFGGGRGPVVLLEVLG